MTMKKVHFVAWLWAVSFWGWSQPTLLTETTSLVAGSSACLEDLLELEIEVLNETGSTMNLYVTRTLLDTVSPFNYPYVFGNEGAQEACLPDADTVRTQTPLPASPSKQHLSLIHI